MFNLQVNASEIGRGIQEDLDMEMLKIGISITSFAISSFNYPEEVQKMAEKAAAQSMIGDVGRFQQVAMGEAIASGKGGGAASDMAGIAMGLSMGQQMAAQMQQNQQAQQNQQMQELCSRRPGEQSRISVPTAELRQTELISVQTAERNWYKSSHKSLRRRAGSQRCPYGTCKRSDRKAFLEEWRNT